MNTKFEFNDELHFVNYENLDPVLLSGYTTVLTFEPMRRNRWLLEIEGIPSYYIRAVEGPNFKLNKFLFFNSYSIENLKIEIMDTIADSSSEKLYNLFHSNKHINLTLKMLDPTGVVIQKWELKGCELIKLNLGDLTYDDDGIRCCVATFKPKSVKLN